MYAHVHVYRKHVLPFLGSNPTCLGGDVSAFEERAWGPRSSEAVKVLKSVDPPFPSDLMATWWPILLAYPTFPRYIKIPKPSQVYHCK